MSVIRRLLPTDSCIGHQQGLSKYRSCVAAVLKRDANSIRSRGYCHGGTVIIDQRRSLVSAIRWQRSGKERKALRGRAIVFRAESNEFVPVCHPDSDGFR